MAFPTFTFSGEIEPAERAFYDEYGFVVYTGFISRAEVDRIQADAEAYQELIRAGEVPSHHIDTVAPTTRGADGDVRYHHRLNYFTRYSPAASQLATSPRMDAVRRGIGGANFWLLDDTMNGTVWQLKSGESKSGYSRIRWHLDFPVEHPLSPAFTAGVYLDDSDRTNGCLAVVPGSHRRPVGLVPPEALYVEVKAGDLICHHERIYHGSDAMPRPSDRRATVYFYFCGGDRPVPDLPFAKAGDMASIQSIFVGADKETA